MRHLAWLLLPLGLLASLPAQAQGSASDAQTAVELAKEAKARYDQGEWRGALELFEAAEEKAHSPVLVLYAARSLRNLGELVAARRLFARVAGEPLGPDAPPPFKAARQDAIADLETLEARIPRLTIDRRAAPGDWQITVDDVVVDEAEVRVDPGKHVVRAGPPGQTRFERELDAEEGTKLTVTVGAPAETGAREEVAPPVTEDAKDEGSGFGASIGPGLIALGLGAAGVGVGVGLRVAALQKVEGVKDRCQDNLCLAEDAEEIDQAETFQTVSTVLFAVGGAVMATGVVLMIVLPEDDESASVGLDLRPGYLGVQGRF